MEETVEEMEYIYNIIIGRNAQENWDIIDSADQNDIWFHLEGHPSPHVILKTGGVKLKEIEKNVIKICAMHCKEHSKFANIRKITVIYTEIKNVSKANKVGAVYTKNIHHIVI